MATENDDAARQNEQVENVPQNDRGDRSGEKPERAERPVRDRFEFEGREERDRRNDIRSNLKAAFKEHAAPKERPERRPRKEDKPDDEQNLADLDAAPKKDGAPEAGEPTPKKDDGKETGTAATAPQAQEAAVPPAPAALSKDIKALWPKLDPSVRNEFARLEAESAKGVEKLKERYKGYDDALAPLKDELRSVGRSEAEGIRMLAEWRNALSGPQKVQAFAALAKLENVDMGQLLSTLGLKSSAQAAVEAKLQQSLGLNPVGQQQQAPQPNDPATLLRPYLDPLTQKLTSLETELQRRDRMETERNAQTVQRDIQSFAKGKPHFDKVRVRMGVLLGNGQVTGDTAQEAFDAAYEQACRSDPEVFSLLQQEAEAKREADQLAVQQAAAQKAADEAKKAADAETERKRKQAEDVEKARRAGIGPRGGSPSGMLTINKTKGESVGESLRRAVKEVRTAI